MFGFFQKLIKLIEKDVKAENESKSMAVLIRYLSGVLVLLCIALLGVFIYLESVYMIVTFAVGLLLSCYIIYITYRGSTDTAFILMIFLIDMISILSTWVNGWRYGFQNLIFVAVIFTFFNMKRHLNVKITSALVQMVLLMILAFHSFHSAGKYKLPDYVMFVNLFAMFAMMMSVGIANSRKFTASEYKLYQYNKKLQKMAGSDPLTGLMNRRNVTDVLNDVAEKYKTERVSFSIAIGDIDFFKKVNDTYGHDCGDYVLKELSGLFSNFMEEKGFIARWGGEEFLFVFKGINADEVFGMLDDLREKISVKELTFKDQNLKVTMTFGLEEYSSREGIDGTIKAADEKLYIGKGSGRNRVIY
ncbi:MAG: GGDEF domain-containing protein [Lachnospiraceae bacterium]|nr:GGDEF domain-containing protein [Lachnospiraceae bacterium]